MENRSDVDIELHGNRWLPKKPFVLFVKRFLFLSIMFYLIVYGMVLTSPNRDFGPATLSEQFGSLGNATFKKAKIGFLGILIPGLLPSFTISLILMKKCEFDPKWKQLTQEIHKNMVYGLLGSFLLLIPLVFNTFDVLKEPLKNNSYHFPDTLIFYLTLVLIPCVLLGAFLIRLLPERKNGIILVPLLIFTVGTLGYLYLLHAWKFFFTLSGGL